MIRITKNGKMFRDKKEITTLFPFLGEEIKIERTPFRVLFEHLLRYAREYNMVFSSALGGYSLEAFAEDLYAKGKKSSKKEVLELSWVAEIYPKIDNELSMYVDVHSRKGKVWYGLSFCSLSYLKQLPIVLDTTFAIQRWGLEGLETNKIGKLSFTVYDVLDGLLYEISFFGSPKERDNQRDELLGRMKETKKSLGSG